MDNFELSGKVRAANLKIAITGSTGFMGVHLIHHLMESGHEVVAIKRKQSKMDQFDRVAAIWQKDQAFYQHLEWVDCELHDPIGLCELFETCEQVVHLAGQISYSLKHKKDLLLVNQEYTENVANAALNANVKHLVYLSSTAAVSKGKEQELVKESNGWDARIPHSFYGLSKHLGEMELQRAQAEGLTTTILNPGVVLGYGLWDYGSLKLFRNAYRQFPFFSEGKTGFIGVNDVCRCLLFFLEHPQHADQYLLVSENKSYGEVARMMAHEFGRKPPWIKVTGLLYYALLGLFTIKDHLRIGGMLSRETAKASVSVHQFDTSKLQSVLPYKLDRIAVVIQKACELYKQE